MNVSSNEEIARPLYEEEEKSEIFCSSQEFFKKIGQ